MLKLFFKNKAGGVAPVFAFSIMLLLIGVGAAIDLTGANKSRKELQNWTDAAALAASMTGEKKVSILKKEAEAVLAENKVEGLDVTIKVSLAKDAIDGKDVVRVEGETTYLTSIMGIIGKNELPVKTVSEARLPVVNRVHVTLVLDQSSLAEAGLLAIKSAATKFVDMFDKYTDNTKAKISVVPYGEYVNVGVSNKDKSWLKLPDDLYVNETQAFSRTPWSDIPDKSKEKDGQVCKKDKKLTNPDACTQKVSRKVENGRELFYLERKCPASAYTPATGKFCEPKEKADTWFGCVGSQNPMDTSSASISGQIDGLVGVRCVEPLSKPSTRGQDAKKTIQNMRRTVGKRYMPAGFIWGWRLLDKSDAFPNSYDEKKIRRILIFISTGKNLGGPNKEYHDGPNTKKSDTYIRETCKSMNDKKEDILIYTIGYKLSNSDAKAKKLLEDCASNKHLYFEAKTQKELEARFEFLGKSLFTVRLSH